MFFLPFFLVRVSSIHIFSCTFFDVLAMVEKCALFAGNFFDEILMGKTLMSFLVSCKLMKPFEKDFLS